MVLFYLALVFLGTSLFAGDGSPKRRRLNPILSEVLIEDVLSRGIDFELNCEIVEIPGDTVAPFQSKNYCMLHALATAITFNNIILYKDLFLRSGVAQTFGNVCQHNSDVLITLLVKLGSLFPSRKRIIDGSVLLTSDHLQLLYEKIPNLPLIFDLTSIVIMPSQLFSSFLKGVCAALKKIFMD